MRKEEMGEMGKERNDWKGKRTRKRGQKDAVGL